MMRWILLGGAVGAAVFVLSRRPSIDDLIEAGYNEGIRDPDFLTAYVAVRLYPGETWPPVLDDTAARIERWTDLEDHVTRWLASANL